MQHLIDTPMVLAQCDRCKKYVFQCQASGLRTIVDPAPLDGMEAVRESLISGRVVYRIVSDRKLQRLTPVTIASATQRVGVQLLGEHDCGPGLVGAADVEVAPVGPPSAPVRPGRLPDGLHPHPAPESGSQGLTELPIMKQDSSATCPSPVERANPRRSDQFVNRRCPGCFELIGYDKNIVGVQLGDRWVWVSHDSC